MFFAWKEKAILAMTGYNSMITGDTTYTEIAGGTGCKVADAGGDTANKVLMKTIAEST